MQRKIYILLVSLQTLCYCSFIIFTLIGASDRWLLPALLIGGALFLILPSIVLFAWGSYLLKSTQSTALHWTTRIALLPIVVAILGVLLTIAVFLIAPPGVAD